MKNMICTTAVAATMLATPTHATPVSSFMDGNTLHDWCRRETGACAGYVIGVHDGISLAKEPGSWFCVPDGVKSDQIRDVVTAFLRGHPKWRHVAASQLVLWALVDAWPCDR